MKILWLFLLLVATATAPAQTKWIQTQQKIQQLIHAFHGEMGLYVLDLKTGRTIEINADTIFPTASMIKIPILVGIMHKIHDSAFSFHQRMTYTDSLYYNEGDDLLASFKSGETLELSRLISLMLSYSDNTASLWLQGLSGGGTVINNYLEQLGLHATRVNSRTEGRSDDREKYGWGQTTPREMSTLMKLILDNKIIDRQISEKMLRMLGRQYWDEYALSQIPPDVFVAEKGGAVDASRGEVLFVNSPHPYIFTICSKNNQDQSWAYNNEAWEVTRKISAILWKYFNPKSKWTPTQPLL